jgi:cyclopropane-fatty-acyl-phospholipid synthase
MTMQTSAPAVPDAAVAPVKRVLEQVLSGMRPRIFDVRFWDGSVWPGDSGSSQFTLVLRHPGAVRRMFWPPKPLSFASAYVYDDFDVEGDMIAFQKLCNYLIRQVPTLPLTVRMRLAWLIWRLPQVDQQRAGRHAAQLTGPRHSRARDREAIRYHYDMPDRFFETILDPYMQYTTGVFDSPDESLATAQERKLDLICRKLRLRPNDRLLDIGCGWGGLAMFAAKNYGARVVGVTLSRSQAEWARGRIRAAGLEEQCRIELIDYRDLDEGEPFDRITTVEVAEHFGGEQFPTYFDKCWRLLRPGGTILHQQITLTGYEVMPPMAEAFMHAFVFPDAELLPVSFTLLHAERRGFEVRDVEGFREHYPLTLKRWLANLEAHEQELVTATDEAAYRVFRLYLAGAAFDFEQGIYNLHQVLLAKPDDGRSGLPLARADWYR